MEHAEAVPPGTMKARTVAAQRTMVKSGTLVCVPFPTSDKPFKRTYPSSIAYGITGGPTTSGKSEYESEYRAVARTSQSVSSLHKIAIPYKMNAARNRIKNDPPPPRLPFSSSLVFGGDLLNKPTRRWSTINSLTQPPATRPMTSKTGFTNPAVTAHHATRLHAVVFR